VVLHMDLMFVNGVAFMTTIDHKIKYRCAIALDAQKEPEFIKALLRIKLLYNRAGVQISDLMCDGQFLSYQNTFEDEPLQMPMSVPPASAHVPMAERNNRVIQERARALYHRLPYRVMPRIMIRYLVMLVTSQLNWFPVKDGISDYFSPHTIIKRFAIDYKACKIPFGSYVMASTEPKHKNTLAPRMLEAIYLRPSKFQHYGHEVMDLNTGRVQ